MLVTRLASRLRPQPHSSCPKETLDLFNTIPPIPSDIDSKTKPKVLVDTKPRKRPLFLKFSTRPNLQPAKVIAINPNQETEQNDATPPSAQIVLESTQTPLPESAPRLIEDQQGDSIQEPQPPPKVEEESNDLGFEPLQKVGPDCYVAIDIEVEAELKQKFDRKHKRRLQSFLQHLPLRDRAVSLECVLACSTPHRDQVQPTILVLCLNEEQQKTINGGLKKRTLIPAQYQCLVVVQEVGFCSSVISIPSDPGIMSGQIVVARILENGTLCGVLGRAINGGFDCTVGGLIRVGGSIYALTTAHGFVGRGGEMPSTIPTTSFQPIGNIHSYKFTETSSHPETNETNDMASFNTSSDQDWALVRVQPLLYRPNSFQDPVTGSTVFIEGHVKSSDLRHGPVTVLSSVSGIRQGYLGVGTSSLLIGDSCFEVKRIALDGSLTLGDSGSWVVRDGKLCGFILGRVVGKPWAYMLSIEQVFQEITQAFSFDGPVSVEVPPRSKLDSLRDTTISLKSRVPIAARSLQQSEGSELFPPADASNRLAIDTTPEVDRDNTLPKKQSPMSKCPSVSNINRKSLSEVDPGDKFLALEKALTPDVHINAEDAGAERTQPGTLFTTTTSRLPGFEVDFAVNDPNNPRNWPPWYRWFAIGSVSFATWTVSLYMTIYTSAMPGMMKELGVTSETVATLGVTTYLLGLAGGLILTPLGENLGRGPIYYGSMLIFCLLALPCALSKSLPEILVVRFFGGMLGTVITANSPGTIADVTDPAHRRLAFSIFSLGQINGLVMGPLIGGFAAQYLGWRWTNWLVMIFAGVGWVMCASIKETYAPVLLRKRVLELRKETRDDRWWCQYDVKRTWQILKITISKPLVLILTEPILWFWNAYVAVVFGSFYLWFVTFPLIYQGLRGWSPGFVGLAFLGIGTGTTLAISSEPLVNRLVQSHKSDPETGRVPHEAFVSIICIAAILVPAGQLWFAWTSVPITIHWIWPILSGIPFGAGCSLVFIYSPVYIVSIYGIHAASALTGISFIRYLVGGTLLLAGPTMFTKMTPQWAGTVLGLIEVALIPVPFVFYKWGKQIRSRSSRARNLQELQERGEEKAAKQTQTGRVEV